MVGNCDGVRVSRNKVQVCDIDYYRYDSLCIIVQPTAHANSECPLDDDALASNIGPMGDPGTIEVHFAHVMEQGQVASQYSFKCDTPRVVHEGSKKMGMHCVS